MTKHLPLFIFTGMNRHAVAKRESESSEGQLVHATTSKNFYN